MNREDIIWRLAQLASLPYQVRYVIESTPSEYVLDTEIIENVESLKFYLEKSENSTIITSVQFQSLNDLFAYIEAHADEALSGQSREERFLLIQTSEVWANLRSRAADALGQFGFTVNGLSAEDIDRLTVA